jgi:predicted XRE-type DNA-binding protein
MSPIGVYARPSLEERFWAKVDTSGGLFACWPWMAALRGRSQYPSISVDGHQQLAGRIALGLAGRPLADDEVARHTCDNHLCVNPAHLTSGTQADNIADKVERDRQAKGSQVGTAKLTEARVAEIRSRITGRRGEQRRLAAEFGVSRTQVSAIVRGLVWRHVA